MIAFLATLLAFCIVIALMSVAHLASRAKGCGHGCAGCTQVPTKSPSPDHPLETRRDE